MATVVDGDDNVAICDLDVYWGTRTGLASAAEFVLNFRDADLSAFGKSSGTSIVTLPVAAHSVPRKKVVMNPTHSQEYPACPKVE